MFDKLVASEPKSADFKNRRRYFVTSSVVVGVLFLAAVVASIFAADFSLGSNSFELAQIISPPEMATVEPETPQPRTNQSRSESQSDLPSRVVNMENLSESRIVPTGVSVTNNTQMQRPIDGRFVTANIDSNGGTPNGSGRSADFVGDDPTDLSQSGPAIEKELETDAPPREIKKPRPPVSKGPLNGYAISLPKPLYSAAAKAVRAHGKVTVQVMIDERGNVVSANAIDGHHMLRADAERAARNAKFSPTILGDGPVKVTGVITYNFIL